MNFTLNYDKAQRSTKADRLENETLTRLTAKEIGLFDLYSIGVFTYRGELKSRRRGFKTEKVNDWQTNFTADHYRVEFIRTHDGLLAARLYDLDEGEYEVDWQVLAGIDFIR